MPRKNGQRGNEATANALRQAFLRLKEERPKHPDLKELKRNGKLALTFRNVAIEADVSRTLIAHDECDYPEIRRGIATEIKKFKARREAGEELGPVNGLDSQTVIERLRKKIIELRVENGTLFTKLDEAVRIARDLEGRLEELSEKKVDDSPRAKRIAAREATAARRLKPPSQGREGMVIQFPDGH